MRYYAAWAAVLMIAAAFSSSGRAEDLALSLRYQRETGPKSGRFHRLTRQEKWPAAATAIIVCDVWDLHHCKNAVDRLAEFAPRLDKVLAEARRRGVTIIHSPSDCMDAYVDHPARKRAVSAAVAANVPAEIKAWCSRIPAEERANYPIDQSDGGEDDDPAIHGQWVKKLKALGRNPGTPWKRQSDLITIDPARDYVSDRGDEVWNILQQRGIQQVILTGVHTNMCVLGRPFGLRQMVRNGKNVVLMRDMTDTMYNPARWPYVSHFTANDLVVSHIERYVCPTVSSDQLLGGKEFRFQGDKRPHLVMVIAEDEYRTEQTLPPFAVNSLGRQFRVSLVFGSEEQRNQLPGLNVLRDADAALISIRRRVLPAGDMKIIRDFVAAGKPMIGIRTASHAFSLRNQKPPQGFVDWTAFDAEVWGGNYTNHHGNKLKSTVRVSAAAGKHAILTGIDSSKPFPQGGSLYKTSPLQPGTTTLLLGRVHGQPEEPAAWTFVRADKGRSFYTSLGHTSDFQNPAFVRLLSNAVCWATGQPIAHSVGPPSDSAKAWQLVQVPAAWETQGAGQWKDYDGIGWYRCVLRLGELSADSSLALELPPSQDNRQVWINGHRLRGTATSDKKLLRFSIPADKVTAYDANLLVIRVDNRGGPGGLTKSPLLVGASKQPLKLAGRWQFRVGDDDRWSNMPLPARFGSPTDIIFDGL